MSLKQADIEREMREDGHLWGEQEQWWNRLDQDTWYQKQRDERREQEDDAYTGA